MAWNDCSRQKSVPVIGARVGVIGVVGEVPIGDIDGAVALVVELDVVRAHRKDLVDHEDADTGVGRISDVASVALSEVAAAPSLASPADDSLVLPASITSALDCGVARAPCVSGSIARGTRIGSSLLGRVARRIAATVDLRAGVGHRSTAGTG